MFRSLIAAAVLAVGTLAATSVMAHDPYRGGCRPQYRSYPSYQHHRSQFQYRSPHHWDAQRNYYRHQSRYPRSYSPYRYPQSYRSFGIHGRNFSIHLGY